MQIDFSGLSGNRIYRVMTQVVIPRPVAWVLTDNGQGCVGEETAEAKFNIAPFSYFTAVCSAPPLLMFSAGKKPDGSRKDTAVNIADHKQFVVHIPSFTQKESVTETSRSLPWGEPELSCIEEPLVDFEGFSLPRIKGAPIAMGCELFEIQEMGKVPQQLIFGEIKTVYIDDSVGHMDEKGNIHVDAKKMSPLSRLGGNDYGGLGEIVSVPRPV